MTALAAVLRCHLDESDVPGRTLPRQDEVHYVDLVRQFMNGDWRVEWFINPTAFGYLVHAATMVVGAVRVVLGFDASIREFVLTETLHPYVIILVGRALALAMGVACIPLIASIGRRVASPAAGLLAALLLAIDQVAVLRSHLCGNEMPMLLFGLLSFRFLLLDESAGGSRRAILSGLFAGIAAGTKYSGGVFLFPSLFTLGRKAWVAAFAAGVGFAIATPSVLLNLPAFLRGFSTQYAYLHGGYYASDAARGERGWIYYLRNFPSTNVGAVFAWISIAGIVVAIADSIRRRDRALHPSLWIVLPVYVFMGSGIFCDMRFLLPALPFILLLGAQLVDRVATRLRIPPALPLLASAAILASPAWTNLEEARRAFGRLDWRTEMLPFFARTAGPDHRVVDFVSKPWDRWFDDADPWATVGMPPPPDPAHVDAVRARLAATGHYLPSTSLHALFQSQPTLAALKASFASRGIDRLVISIPAHCSTDLDSMAVNIASLRYLLQHHYWKDAFAWFSTFRVVEQCIAANGVMLVWTLEVPRGDGDGK